MRLARKRGNQSNCSSHKKQVVIFIKISFTPIASLTIAGDDLNRSYFKF
jgi:hypothetical protein